MNTLRKFTTILNCLTYETDSTAIFLDKSLTRIRRNHDKVPTRKLYAAISCKQFEDRFTDIGLVGLLELNYSYNRMTECMHFLRSRNDFHSDSSLMTITRPVVYSLPQSSVFRDPNLGIRQGFGELMTKLS